MKASNRIMGAVAALAFGAWLGGVAPGSAGTLVIGAPATGQNFIPFGSVAGFPEYQQVYAKGDFSGTQTINDIEFYVYSGSGAPNTGVVTIKLSETSAPVNGLSTTLSANFGTNTETVFHGLLPPLAGGVLEIALSTPYTYNPASGNLLLDIVEATPYSGGPGFEFSSDPADPVFSRGFSGQTIPVANSSGLVTGFVVAPGPTPGAGLLGLAFLIVAGAMIKARAEKA